MSQTASFQSLLLTTEVNCLFSHLIQSGIMHFFFSLLLLFWIAGLKHKAGESPGCCASASLWTPASYYKVQEEITLSPQLIIAIVVLQNRGGGASVWESRAYFTSLSTMQAREEEGHRRISRSPSISITSCNWFIPSLLFFFSPPRSCLKVHAQANNRWLNPSLRGAALIMGPCGIGGWVAVPRGGVSLIA